ncbi:MAG: hypothetical protein K2I67_00725 [Malacoplasma sp.]|nr:hypothetical protein [Malacoplasma sp.]
MKKTILGFTSLTLLAFLSPLTINSFFHNYPKLPTTYFYNENLKNTISKSSKGNFEKWYSSITESYSNTNVKLFLTRNASLVFQESFMIFRYMLSKDETLTKLSTSSLDSSKSNTKDYIYTIDNATYNFDSSDNIKSNYSFSQFDNDKNKITDTNSTGNFMLLSNTNQIPKSSDSKPNNKYLGADPKSVLEMLKEINSYYSSIDSSVKYDLWIADLSIIELWDLHSTEFLDILKNINKIYVLSDGNVQTNTVAFAYIERQKSFGLLTDDQMKNDITDFKSKNTDSATIQKFNASSIYDYFRYTDFFTIFHIKDYSESPIYTSKAQMYKVNEIDWNIQQFANKMMADNLTAKTSLINNYFNFFKFDDLSSINLNYFITQGLENYDPRKKNIIWIGDALIPDSNNVLPEKKNEIQQTFKALTIKYNPDEYNYFFKHHPRYSLDVQNQLTALISNGLVNAIYFKSFIWEIFLQWDHYKQNQDAEYIPFFSNTSNDNIYSQTTFIGIQYISTAIPTTLFFLQNTYGMSLEKAQKTVLYNNFPIPRYFSIVNPGNPTFIDPVYQELLNREKINQTYQAYLQMNVFPNYTYQLNTEEFIKGYIHDYDIKKMEIIAISISVFLIICIVAFVSVIIFLNHNKKNKLDKNL